MRTTSKLLAIRYAKRWAEEQHDQAVWKLPEEIRRAINWEGVARNLAIEWPEMDAPTIEQDLQRIVDYLYEAEATDYDFLEHRFQPGHIFESISAVQRWLAQWRN